MWVLQQKFLGFHLIQTFPAEKNTLKIHFFPPSNQNPYKSQLKKDIYPRDILGMLCQVFLG